MSKKIEKFLDITLKIFGWVTLAGLIMCFTPVIIYFAVGVELTCLSVAAIIFAAIIVVWFLIFIAISIKEVIRVRRNKE